MATISEALAIAIRHHQAGRLQAAEQIYRQILAVEPNQADAIHLLGAIAHQVGRHAIAVEYIGRAIGLNGNVATYHNTLGESHRALRRIPDAVACYRRALELNPDFPEAHNNLGVALKGQGKLDEAVACYRRALELKPDFTEAYNNLGAAFRDQEKLDEAIACYRRAIELKPNYAEAHYNLGNARKDQDKLDEAVACYRRAIELKPNYAEAHNNLGVALKDQGNLKGAVACYRQVLELKPDSAEACNNLGVALKDQGNLDESVACCRRALALKPDYAEAHNNLGTALKDQGKLEEAVAFYRRALELKPDYVEAYNNLGAALYDQGNLDGAVACYRRALELRPDYAEAHNNLGNALKGQEKLDEAVACYRRALELKPGYVEAHGNLGTALKNQGKSDQAVACYRRALELKPEYAEVHSNLLLTLQYCEGVTPTALAEAHAEYDRRHAAPLRGAIAQHENAHERHSRLRLGFVSPDLGRHPVGYFLVRVLENLGQTQWETVCYSDRIVKDGLTHRLQAAATQWCDVSGMSDQRLAEQIRADRIDILFDLAGHTAHNRLPVFARKPAPIQITWIGYEGTTGLAAMDYLVADRYVVPEGTEHYYRERVSADAGRICLLRSAGRGTAGRSATVVEARIYDLRQLQQSGEDHAGSCGGLGGNPPPGPDLAVGLEVPWVGRSGRPAAVSGSVYRPRRSAAAAGVVAVDFACGVSGDVSACGRGAGSLSLFRRRHDLRGVVDGRAGSDLSLGDLRQSALAQPPIQRGINGDDCPRRKRVRGTGCFSGGRPAATSNVAGRFAGTDGCLAPLRWETLRVPLDVHVVRRLEATDIEIAWPPQGTELEQRLHECVLDDVQGIVLAPDNQDHRAVQPGLVLADEIAIGCAPSPQCFVNPPRVFAV